MLHAALYHPAIPQNTGNAARTCVGFNTHLHVIHPASFQITDASVQRAGLDYWPHLNLTEHADDDAFLRWLDGRKPWLITKLGTHRFDQAPYEDGDVLLFGNENTGLPDAWHHLWPDRGIYIPVLGPIRSFNVANTVAICTAQATARAGLANAHNFAGEKIDRMRP